MKKSCLSALVLLVLISALWGVQPSRTGWTVAAWSQDNAEQGEEVKGRKAKKEAKAEEAEADKEAKEAGGADSLFLTGSEKPGDIKTKWGVFGHFTTGFNIGTFGGLNDDLKKEDLFTDQFSMRYLGSYYGGSVFFQIGNRFLVGGTVMGMSFNTSAASNTVEQGDRNEIGDVHIRNVMFGGHVGFAVLNKTRWGKEKSFDADKMITTEKWEFKYRWMLFPYVGFAVGKSTMTLANWDTDELYFGGATEGVLLPRITKVDFKANMNVIDFGIGTRFFKSKKGGLMVGVELGGYIGVGGGTWESQANEDNPDVIAKEVSSANNAGLMGGYLRFNVGGGFLSIKSDPSVPATEEGEDAYEKPSDTLESSDSTSTEAPKKKKKAKKTQESTEAAPADENATPAGETAPAEEQPADKPKKEKKAKKDKAVEEEGASEEGGAK